jgi:hypothetical protein
MNPIASKRALAGLLVFCCKCSKTIEFYGGHERLRTAVLCRVKHKLNNICMLVQSEVALRSTYWNA